jgi:tetratricopeptide (TPR) repeat protein
VRKVVYLHVRIIAVACLFAIGCHHRAPPSSPKPHAAQAVQPAPVPDEVFALSVHKLLRDGRQTPARDALLAGVIARQLAHAKDRFEARQNERGVASVTGALHLVRAGEYQPNLVAAGTDALKMALDVVAPRGDEGRSAALYSIRSGLLAPGSAARKDTDDHIAALSAWMRETRKDSSLVALGADERALAQWSLFEPTAEVLARAREATVRWIDGSLKLMDDAKASSRRPRREDAMEAFRAMRSGAETLAAIHLRHGDAAGALADIEQTSAGGIVARGLHERLARAANGGDAIAHRELLSWLWNPGRHESTVQLPVPSDDPDFAIDPGLLRSALWGTALEAYRLDPMLTDVNAALATLLVQLGLPEAAPFVLADAVVSHPEAAPLSAALGVVLETIVREEEAEDTASARWVYAAAGPILSVAARPELRDQIEPTAARVRAVMGSIETRAGNLATARSLLESAASVEASVDTFATLANIDRQARRTDKAIEHLLLAIATPEAKENPVARGEAYLRMCDIHQDMRALDKAGSDLALALDAALDARQRSASLAAKAHAERLFARVLDHYADGPGAARAIDRAFAAADQNKHEVTATMLEAAQRAFVRRDPAAGRAAVTRGLSVGLRDDDLVYAALWLLLVEKDMKAASDGTAARALSNIKDDGRWPSRLAAWGLGKIKDADLATDARTVGQKTEASFYAAVSRRIAGDSSAAAALLGEVANSTAIDLVEVELARALLGRSPHVVGARLPAGVKIP